LSLRPSAEHKQLARTIAKWASTAPTVTIYVFGSRVRGDHRTDSDVDICIQFPETISDALLDWWEDSQATDFADLKARLPGPLKILEEDDPVWQMVAIAPALHPEGNVCSVWMPPKPTAT
jgi:predicted nucleotidyltransferase